MMSSGSNCELIGFLLYAYRLALEEWTGDRVPLQYKTRVVYGQPGNR
jgi:hypothetical protein